jgi:hypothetical protein
MSKEMAQSGAAWSSDKLIAELIRIGAEKKVGPSEYFPISFYDPFDGTKRDSWESARTQQIGKDLFQKGGVKLLVAAKRKVAESLGVEAEIELSSNWNQVDWSQVEQKTNSPSPAQPDKK